MAHPNPAIARAIAAMEAAASKAAADSTRPVYHFRPPSGWMNDVNGPLYHEGYHHIFYQLNPYHATFDDYMHWGHARSKDLVHWQHLPIALWPSTEKGETGCWSGTACFNGAGQPMIFYTKVGPAREADPFEQWAALGHDDLITWEKHPANPILDLKTHGGPLLDRCWRDPFIFTEQGRTFMVLGAAGRGTPIYEAQDQSLAHWAYRGIISDLSVECPNFFRLGEKWVMITSPFDPVEYFIGSFDLEELVFRPEVQGRIEETGHFYGTNILFDDSGRCIFLGRLLDFGEGRGWNGCMALPRILSLGPDGRPRQVPVPELQKLRGAEFSALDLALDDSSQVLEGIRGDTLEIIAEFAPGDAAACGLKVRRSHDGSSSVAVRFDGRALEVGDCTFPFLLTETESILRLHIFLDKSVMEVFVNDGRAVATEIIHPDEDDLSFEVFAESGSARVRLLEVWEMRAVW